MTDRDALLVLNAVPNMDAVLIRRLIEFFGSAHEVLEASLEGLNKSGLLMADAAQNLFNFSKDKFLSNEYNLMQQRGIVALTAADENFPSSLKDFEDAPVVLYVMGDLECLTQNSVALVGSRAASFYGVRLARSFAQDFVHHGLNVVSGLARGIDTAAHQGALDAGGKTIAIVGCGFNYVYPKENHSLMKAISHRGAVVTEFASHMPPLKHNFPWRNRIISALSKATVVVEAGLKSGALITADFAVAQNKDVFVLPSNVDNERALGSNRLIQEGARVALNPEDVLSQIARDYFPLFPHERKPVLLLSDEQSKVYPLITCEPVHLNELVKQSGLNISTLMNITLSLELKRAIRQLPGQYYVRNENA